MATKFFNNESGDTLFDKLKGIVDGMGVNFHTFQAVSGYSVHPAISSCVKS